MDEFVAVSDFTLISDLRTVESTMSRCAIQTLFGRNVQQQTGVQTSLVVIHGKHPKVNGFLVRYMQAALDLLCKMCLHTAELATGG